MTDTRGSEGISGELKAVPPEDIDAFLSIQAEYLERWTLDHLREERAKNPDLYIGCYLGGKLVAIAYGSVRGEAVTLQGIAVTYALWRRGIGSRLLDYFEEQARKTQKKRVGVGSGEGFAEQFYIKNGYRPLEVQAKSEDHRVLARESVKDYEDGLKKRGRLREKLHPKEVIFIMEKEL